MAKYLEKMVEMIIFAVGSLMVIFMFAQIILRSLFDYSFQWSDEFARFGMIWITYLGAALIVKERGHIKVEYFLQFIPSKKQKYGNLFLNVLMSVFIIVLLLNSTSVFTEAMKQTTPGLGIPYGLVVLAMPVGGILMILYLIMDCIRWFKESEEK